MANILNITYRKVGGLRFLKVGRLTVSFSVTKRLTTIYTAKPVVERKGEQFAAIVKLYKSGRLVKQVAGPELFALPGDAMAHAVAGIAAVGLKAAR
ncbi:hypothetical protein [Bosea sp. MMO-172]|uniref:hypothetical protein n=1 Tax=Bosea sp. MMO-172 TaxID=3127885 RepID=UPI003015FD60